MVNKYVRAGASGGGTNWTDAYGSLPATLTRGDTYYIASGSYGGYTFDDADSGPSVITIKKATVGDHGTSAGWSDSYASGQAVFTGGRAFTINTNYLTVDGVTGSGTSGHGIKLVGNSIGGNGDLGVITSYNGWQQNHLIFKHIEIAGTGGGRNDSTQRGVYFAGASGSLSVDHQFYYVYVHDVAIWASHGSVDDMLFDHCYFKNAGGNGPYHTAGLRFDNKNWTLRYSVLENMLGGSNTTYIEPNYPVGVYIYGNVYRSTSPNEQTTQWSAFSTAGAPQSQYLHNFHFYNNTIYGLRGGNPGIQGSNGSASNIYVRNNIWQNCVNNPSFSGVPVQDNNILNTGGVNFVDAANGDFHLTSNIVGANLGAPYNVDPDNRTRSSWSRGAYEFASATTPIISVSPSSLNFGSTSVGNSVDRTPSVTNTGGGTLSGAVTTTSPYSVGSGTPYRLTAGQSQDVAVRFTPTAIGTVEGDLNFNGEPGSPGTSIRMTGAGAGILGLEFDADEGTIEAPFTIDGSGNVSQSIDTQGDVAAGGRATYTFNAPAGNYSILVSVNAPTPAENSFYVNIDAEPTDPTMTWDAVQTTTGFEDRSVYWRGAGTFDAPEFQPKVFTLTAGVHQLIIVGREANAAFAHITFVLVSPVSIIPATPPSGVVNTPYSFQFNATGGQPPYRWSNDPGSYPPGITLSSSTGLLSGTPTQDGTFPWSIRAEDANNEEASLAISVVIDPEVIPLSVTTTLIPDATADEIYSYTLQATGGTLPYTWTLTGGGLPPGLSLASSGEISGTPTPLGSNDIYLLDVTVEDADSNTASSENLTLTVWGGLDPVPAIISVI